MVAEPQATVSPGVAGRTDRLSAADSTPGGSPITGYTWRVEESVVDDQPHPRTARTSLTVHFASSRAGPSARDRRGLIKLRVLFAHATRVKITGYCAWSKTNRSATLARLSLDRARMVLALLKAHHNRSSARVTTRGAAANHFVASSRTAAGPAANRRATITITYPAPTG